MNFASQIYTLTEGATAGGGGLYMILMIGVLLLVMYFLMIRPQRKQERETNAMRNGLQVGDEITTIGGIIGKIVSIKGETCTIETGKARTKIRILKSAVKCVDVPASVADSAIPASADPAKLPESAADASDPTDPSSETAPDAAPEAAPEENAGKKGKKKSKKSE